MDITELTLQQRAVVAAEERNRLLAEANALMRENIDIMKATIAKANAAADTLSNMFANVNIEVEGAGKA